MVQDLDINTYALYNNFFNGSHLQKDRQKNIISEVDLRAKTKRAELVEASRKRRTMEILKERYLKNHKNKEAKQAKEHKHAKHSITTKHHKNNNKKQIYVKPNFIHIYRERDTIICLYIP